MRVQQRDNARMLAEDPEDVLLLQAVQLHMATDTGRWWGLDEVAAELGVDLELLSGIEGDSR